MDQNNEPVPTEIPSLPPQLGTSSITSFKMYFPGDRIGGQFHVHKTLKGGMGIVYLCLDTNTRQSFALKTMQQDLSSNLKSRLAFENESKIWISLGKHPNIVRCFSYQIYDGQPFIILQWISGDILPGLNLEFIPPQVPVELRELTNLVKEQVKGVSLRHWLIKLGKLDLEVTLRLAMGICRGLIYAGQKQPGIVHRDLKPENILIDIDEIPKIADFGLAKIVQKIEAEARNQKEETIENPHKLKQAGTPQYMAPEQWIGEELDVRTDIYALGCILYEMLMGKVPFTAQGRNDLRHQHLEGIAPSLDDSMPYKMNVLISRCMMKRPDDRLSSLEEILLALDEIYKEQFTEVLEEISPDEADSIDHHNAGMAFMELGNYSEAVDELTYSIELDPANALHYSSRGYALGFMNRYEEALVDINRAIELDPVLDVAYINRGEIYTHLSRYEEALADLNYAITLDPNDEKAYVLRGNLYSAMKYYDEAISEYGHALQLNPSYVQAYEARAYFYLFTKRYEEALKEYSRVIGLDPLRHLAYFARGVLLKNLKRFDEALTDFTHAIALNKNDTLAYAQRGHAYVGLGRYAEALADFDRALELDPNEPTIYLFRADYYEALGNYDIALIDDKHAIELDPNNVRGYIGCGSAYSGMNRIDEAFSVFNHAIQIDPENPDAYTGRGLAYHGLNLLEEALSDFDHAIQLGTDDPIAYAQRGTIYIKFGEYNEALTDFNYLIECYPTRPEGYLGIGIFLWNKNMFHDALLFVDKAAQLGMQEAAQHLERAEQELGLSLETPTDLAQMALNAFVLASSLREMRSIAAQFQFMNDPGFIRDIEHVISNIPTELRFVFEKRLNWLRQAINEQANVQIISDSFEDFSIDESGTSAEDHNNRGIKLLLEQQFTASLKNFNRAIELNPNISVFYTHRAYAYISLEQYDEAFSDFNRAFALDPNSSDLYNNRGNVYLDLKRYSEALIDLNRAVELDPTNAVAYYNRGLTYSNLQRDDEALADYILAAKIDPSDPDFQLKAGMLLGERGEVDKALLYLEKAATLGRSKASLDASLAAIHYALRIDPKQLLEQAISSEINSLDEMRRVIQRLPYLINRYSIKGLEIVSNEYEGHPLGIALKSRLAWLKELASEQENTTLKQRDEGTSATKRLEDMHISEIRSIDIQEYFDRAAEYEQTGYYKEALIELDKAASINLKNVQPYIKKGIIHVGLRQYTEAIADFTRAIALDPNNVQAHNGRGFAYARQGRRVEALVDFDRAIFLDPKEANTYNSRGLMYYDLSRYSEAQKDFLQAIKLNPRFSDAYVSMGAVLAEQGEFSNALTYFESAAALGSVNGALAAIQARKELHKISSSQVPMMQATLERFLSTESLDDMRSSVERFPFLNERSFLQFIESIAKQEALTWINSAFQRRLKWLKQIKKKDKGLLGRFRKQN